MTDSSRFRRTPIAAAVFAAVQAATAAQAQEEPAKSLPKISVEAETDEGEYKPERASSPKFTEPLLNTPQTVTVIRKEIIAEQGATTLTEALRNTPGITFQLGENGNTQSGDTIFMRGFDTQSNIFIDGIRDVSPAVRDVFNIEQIEIFKGPAGADNGRGATSGYVNLASKVPHAQDAASSTISYGTESHRRLTADWNHALDSLEGAAFRLNVIGQDGGVAGRDFVERETWGVAPSFAAGLGSDTRFYLYSQHIRQDNIPDGAVSAIGVADQVIPILAQNGITPARVDQENFYGLASDFEDIDVDMFTVRIEHDFSPSVSIRNTSRYSKAEQERLLTAPIQAPTVADGDVVRTDPNTWTVNRSRQASFRENELLTNQTNLTATFRTGGLEHTISGGFEFIYEEQFTPTYVNASFGTAPPANLYNPNPYDELLTSPNPTTNGAFSEGSTFTTGIYLFDTIKFAERWQVNLGLRIDDYETEFDSVTATGTPIVRTPFSAEDSDTLFNWKAGLLYKPAENGSVYVAYSISRKPPGSDNFTLVAGTTTNNAQLVNLPGLDPQKATNIELGTKWDLLEGRLAATAAIFHSENENDLARQDPGDPDGIVQYGKKEVKGVELGLVGRVTDTWQLSAGVTRQDTEVKEGQITATANQNGAAINFSPKWSATLWTTYDLPFGLTVGGGVRYLDNQARQINITPTPGGVFTVPSYTVFDLFASYDVTENIGVQLNAYNVTDKFYVQMINNSGQRYAPGSPRSYLLTVNLRL